MILIITGCLALLYLIYSLLFLGQIYPNVRIGGVEFGGLTPAQARVRLETLVARQEANPVKLVHEDHSQPVAPQGINWQVNLDQTVARLYGIGRGGDVWDSLLTQLIAPAVSQPIDPVVNFDQEALVRTVSEFADRVDKKATDARGEFVAGQLSLTTEKVGRKINQETLVQELLRRLRQFDLREIVVEDEFDSPQIVIADRQELEAGADKLSRYQLTLYWQGSERVVRSGEIKELIGFVGKKPENPVTETPIKQTILTAEFTRENILAYLQKIAAEIDRKAKDPKLIIKDGALSISQSSQEGRVVDQEKSAENILAALSGTELSVRAEVVLKAEAPVISEGNLESLGIKELIGRGETSFAGSPQNRKANINNGVNILSSALIKPGEEFSTVKTLGKIDDTTGFLPELVIKENKTVPEFGGGLCQVSTTLFRAVLNAGLKVTERQNHSYRVGYYEPPVGLDATIYLPRPDFKFLNDTPAHILLQGKVEGNKVIFEFWGTKDNRTVTISEPIVTDITEPPPPIYADTDTLPKGETKQIEKPHQGAKASVTYTVTREGKEINKQTFKSFYKAWPARFLVGTREG